jgi:uncharacterized protein (TIGR01777 family)
MKSIVIAGGSGFLGRALQRHFESVGWRVVILTRRPIERTDVHWDGRSDQCERHLESADALVNLCGRSVDCRYTPVNRKEILDSRVLPTRALGEAIARCAIPPKAWLNASTATIYKHTFGPPLEEGGEIGAHPEAEDEFSIEVAKAWEDALAAAATPHTRKVALRTAMVLGEGRNSVFPVLKRLARFGLGGKMGSGRQYVSWIHEADFCRAVEFIIEHTELSGAINVAAPNPVTNSEMMRMFREICGAKIGLPASDWILRIGAFIMRTEPELVLKSRRVIPGRLLQAGFRFQFPEMRPALTELNSRA